MAKNLASKLRTGAMIGLAGLALGATAPKAHANPVISYTPSIQQIDVGGNGFNMPGDVDDFYRVSLNVNNVSNTGIPADNTCWRLDFLTDLQDRGCYNFSDEYSAWTFDSNGEGVDYWQFGENVLEPGFANTISYDVLAKDVIGWETAEVKLLANSGYSNSFNASVPQTVPEPTTMGALATGAIALLAGRRLKENYSQR